MTTIALPDTINDRIKDKREITYRWERPDVEVPDKMGDSGVRCAELFVYHSATRKEYVATLHLVTVFPGWMQQDIAPGHSITIWAQPVARHSAKALQQFANLSLQAMLDNMDDYRVASLFAGQPYPR